jgi:hypothetical protein
MNLMTESNRSTSSTLVRDVIALGKKYAGAGFPNPNRVGCPNSSTLRAMAYRDRRLGLQDIPAAHIVRCSRCFQEYKEFRRMALIVRRIQITAASLAVAAMIFLTARFAWNHAHRSGEPSLAAIQRTPNITPFPLKVDLASFSPTRGDASDHSEKKVHLPQKLLRVDFILPLGLEPGEYEIRLQDSKGTVFIDKRALGRMNDGVTSVGVDIDLASATRGNFTLMIRPPGMDWRRFPAVVE